MLCSGRANSRLAKSARTHSRASRKENIEFLLQQGGIFEEYERTYFYQQTSDEDLQGIVDRIVAGNKQRVREHTLTPKKKQDLLAKIAKWRAGELQDEQNQCYDSLDSSQRHSLHWFPEWYVSDEEKYAVRTAFCEYNNGDDDADVFPLLPCQEMRSPG